MCPDCSGSLVDAPALRQSVGHESLEWIWARIDRGEPADIDCPACGTAMLAAKVDGVVLDGCPSHDIVWFDGDEIKRFRAGLEPAETNRMVNLLDGLA